MKITLRKTQCDPIQVELEPSDIELEVPCNCKLGKMKDGRKCYHCDGKGWHVTPLGYKVLEFVKRHQ